MESKEVKYMDHLQTKPFSNKTQKLHDAAEAYHNKSRVLNLQLLSFQKWHQLLTIGEGREEESYYNRSEL